MTTATNADAGFTPDALAQLDRCNKCGFCLPTCPTFVRLGVEPASPRGRLAIAEEVAAGRQPLDSYVADQMYLCLGCRACETACPSGVEFGIVLQETRSLLEGAGVTAPGHDGVPRLLLDQVIAHPRRLALAARLFRWYQRSGLQAWVRRSGWLRRLAPAMVALEAGLPDAAAVPAVGRLPTAGPEPTPRAGARAQARAAGHAATAGGAAADGPVPRGDGRMGAAAGPSQGVATGVRQEEAPAAGPGVAMFRGCLMDVLYGPSNDRAARALGRLGYRVGTPAGQVCCGALHAHAGLSGEAAELARRNIAAFEACGADLYVNTAGGCGAFLREYGRLLQADAAWASRAAAFSSRVRDFSEAVCAAPRWPEVAARAPASGAPGAGGPRITYQDSCHLRHGQRVAAEPRAILRRLDGATFEELPGADTCCGSAGLYSLAQPGMAARVLGDKMAEVGRLGPDVVVTANPGCQMQMQAGVRGAGLGERVRVLHLADLVDAALAGTEAEAPA